MTLKKSTQGGYFIFLNNLTIWDFFPKIDYFRKSIDAGAAVSNYAPTWTALLKK